MENSLKRTGHVKDHEPVFAFKATKSPKGVPVSRGFSVFNIHSNSKSSAKPAAYATSSCLPQEATHLLWLAGLRNPNLRVQAAGALS